MQARGGIPGNNRRMQTGSGFQPICLSGAGRSITNSNRSKQRQRRVSADFSFAKKIKKKFVAIKKHLYLSHLKFSTF
jgi:hypothetical protein